MRSAGDIDLLVDDARGALAALRRQGFILTGPPGHVDVHHLQPLIWPNVPVRIELHHAPKWIDGLTPPPISELVDLAVPARGDAEGFETLAPAAHAVIVAVHAWAHEPLGSLRNLIDVALLKAEARDGEAEVLARRWGVADVWKTTAAAVEALFAGAQRPLTIRLWARHLEAARGRTVAESHVERLLSPFWAFPARSAVHHAGRRLAEEVQPVPGERWRTKLSRARLAVSNAGMRRSSHERVLEEMGFATPSVLFLDRVERRRRSESA